ARTRSMTADHSKKTAYAHLEQSRQRRGRSEERRVGKEGIARQEGLLGTIQIQYTRSLFWKPFDYLTLLFEVGFVIAIASPRATRLFFATAVVFPFSVCVWFCIVFSSSVVAYAVFFEWSAVIDRVRAPGTEPPASR